MTFKYHWTQSKKPEKITIRIRTMNTFCGVVGIPYCIIL